jgi:hypothetical protein
MTTFRDPDRKYYSFIHSEEDIKKFSSLIWGEDSSEEDIFFISLSARNKYLTEEQRKLLNLGRTEMFERKLIHEPDRLLKTIKRYESTEGSYLTKNSLPIPEKAIVVYANINPCSTLHAYREIQDKMMEYILELASPNQNYEKRKETLKRLSKFDAIMLNAFQRSRSRKAWIDIDIDSKNQELLDFMVSEFKKAKLSFEILSTRSGYHILIRTRSIKCNYTEIVTKGQEVLRALEGDVGEVVINTNQMVPVPGTFQADHKVVFYES